MKNGNPSEFKGKFTYQMRMDVMTKQRNLVIMKNPMERQEEVAEVVNILFKEHLELYKDYTMLKQSFVTLVKSMEFTDNGTIELYLSPSQAQQFLNQVDKYV